MNQNEAQEEILVPKQEVQHMIRCLPKATYIGTKLLMYQGTWYHDGHIKNVLAFQRHFQARDTDLIIASLPRTGSTWLKSILFAIVNRKQHSNNQSPLLVNHPHELVYSLETDVYGDAFVYPRPHHLSELPSPRLLSTHLSYTSLPESIKTSNCRILYISRNPLDMLVSLYYFSMNVIGKYLSSNIWRRIMGVFYTPPSMEDFFQALYEEKFPFGPFFEHVIGYWKMSLERPDKVLFLKYEDMKEDPLPHLKKLAEFVGMPFSGIRLELQGTTASSCVALAFRTQTQCHRHQVAITEHNCFLWSTHSVQICNMDIPWQLNCKNRIFTRLATTPVRPLEHSIGVRPTLHSQA